MTRRKRTHKEAELIKLQLADIIQDTFDNNGPLITHKRLAERHVARNGSLSASDDVRMYGPAAVAYLRCEPHNYAIVPVTARFEDYTGDPKDETVIADAVAGLGAGGSRIGWYQPADKDDWLWVYYVGHLGRAGVHAVFHAAQQIENNPRLVSPKGRQLIAGRAISGLPVPPGKTETKVLEARLAGS